MSEVPIKTIDDRLNVKSDFVDYTRFEDSDADARKSQKQAFLDDEEYTPRYRYPKLEFFQDDTSTTDKKSEIYESVLEIEQARRAAAVLGDKTRQAELMLYRKFHDLRLQKIMLVEAAKKLHTATTSGEQEVAVESYKELNAEIFGEMNQTWWLEMLKTESFRLEGFEPKNSIDKMVKQQLSTLLPDIPDNVSREPELLSSSEMKKLHDFIVERYGKVLDIFPQTGDDIRYNAEQCADIFNSALGVNGMAEKGWACKVDPAKSGVSTNAGKKIISLPKNTSRTSAEFQRLFLHEAEVHGRRGLNGEINNNKLLQNGTAEYVDVEEGLGVLLECGLAGSLDNPSFDRARERYIAAGLALGLDGYPRDARETFETLWRIIAIDDNPEGNLTQEQVSKAREKAYAHIENAYRGTDFYMKGTIYSKLKVYYEGFKKNADFIKGHIDNLGETFDKIMVGKYNHTDEDEFSLIQSILGKSND